MQLAYFKMQLAQTPKFYYDYFYILLDNYLEIHQRMHIHVN